MRIIRNTLIQRAGEIQGFFVLKLAVFTETAVFKTVKVSVEADESFSNAHCFMQRLSDMLDLLRCMTRVLSAATPQI